MKLNIAKKPCPIKGNEFFYVSSEANPDETYIVLETQNFGGKSYFCQCKDFFVRRLPLAKTPHFTDCKHIKVVKNFFEENKKKFEIWTVPGKRFHSHFKSSINGSKPYASRESAQRRIDSAVAPHGRAGYMVKEVV